MFVLDMSFISYCW